MFTSFDDNDDRYGPCDPYKGTGGRGQSYSIRSNPVGSKRIKKHCCSSHTTVQTNKLKLDVNGHCVKHWKIGLQIVSAQFSNQSLKFAFSPQLISFPCWRPQMGGKAASAKGDSGKYVVAGFWPPDEQHFSQGGQSVKNVR